MKINRSLLMCALPVALAFVAASAQGEPVIAQAEAPKPEARSSFKTESPTMARSIRDWRPEQSGKTTAAKVTTQPAEEMTESAATRELLPPQPGKRWERAQEIPLKSIPQ